jgi:hypothetical protein
MLCGRTFHCRSFNISEPFEAGPVIPGPFEAGPFEAGPFEDGRFVGAPLLNLRKILFSPVQEDLFFLRIACIRSLPYSKERIFLFQKEWKRLIKFL